LPLYDVTIIEFTFLCKFHSTSVTATEAV